jgi:hypothetical protein
MDPLIFCGLCGVASAGVGYVVGSALFGSLWRLFNRDVSSKMEQVSLSLEYILYERGQIQQIYSYNFAL